MSRRKKNDDLTDLLLDVFVSTPWWTPIPAAAIFFAITVGFWYLVSVQLSHAHWSWPMASEVGLIVAAGVLLIGLVSQFKKRAIRKLLQQNQTLDSIRKLSWQTFEKLVAAAYTRQGFIVHEEGGAMADGGVDVRLRRGNQTILVQCKHWRSQQVGVAIVREVYGVLMHERATSAVIVTSGSFTSDGIEFAQGKPLELIDGPRLVALIAPSETQSTISTAKIVAPPLTNIAVPPTTEPQQLKCPKCGSIMVRRQAHRGSHAGESFWGCSQYPACRGVVNV